MSAPSTYHGAEECDLLVVGSGAAGLAAAITAAHHGLRVIVAEKTAYLGGTSAWSGGWLWIPRNPLAVEAGIDEPASAPHRYLQSELGNRAADPRLEVFLENGPQMVRFFRDHTAVEWIDGNRIPDFHESPGYIKGGRSVSAKPFDARQLGQLIDKLRPPLGVISLWGMGIASGAEMAHFFNATRRPKSALYVTGRLLRHVRDLALHGRSMRLVNGNALVGRLLKSAQDLHVRLLTDAPATGLIRQDGQVTGASVMHAGKPVNITARRGVVLATGGFPHDPARIAASFGHAPDGNGHFSAAPKTNTGDGLRLGEIAGGLVDMDLEQPGAWAPVSLVPDGRGGFHHFPHLVERAKPGIIAVDASGRRFVNEADSYYDFMQALFARSCPDEPSHAWLICDHRAQRRYGLGWSKPFPFPLGRAVRSGYLKRGASLAELAVACDLPADRLAETVAAFNASANSGADPEYHRGESAYNRVQGDPDHGPNPCLGPLTRGPFYAVRIVPGSLGTFAGLKTDTAGRVLDAGGQPVPGLFAAGNDMASIMGGHYPSGGITLGPGMTFGYVIGRTLAGHPPQPRDTPETTGEAP